MLSDLICPIHKLPFTVTHNYFCDYFKIDFEFDKVIVCLPSNKKLVINTGYNLITNIRYEFKRVDELNKFIGFIIDQNLLNEICNTIIRYENLESFK